jgi:hypothetical protein
MAQYDSALGFSGFIREKTPEILKKGMGTSTPNKNGRNYRMSKDKFQVGDLVFWRGEDKSLDDMGLVIEVLPRGFDPASALRILWLMSEDPIGRFAMTHSALHTQQEWDARNE